MAEDTQDPLGLLEAPAAEHDPLGLLSDSKKKSQDQPTGEVFTDGTSGGSPSTSPSRLPSPEEKQKFLEGITEFLYAKDDKFTDASPNAMANAQGLIGQLKGSGLSNKEVDDYLNSPPVASLPAFRQVKTQPKLDKVVRDELNKNIQLFGRDNPNGAPALQKFFGDLKQNLKLTDEQVAHAQAANKDVLDYLTGGTTSKPVEKKDNLERVGSAWRSLVKGVVKTPGEIDQGLGYMSALLDRGTAALQKAEGLPVNEQMAHASADEKFIYQAGAGTNKFIDDRLTAKTDKKYEDEFLAHDLPETAGSLAGMYLGGGLVKMGVEGAVGLATGAVDKNMLIDAAKAAGANSEIGQLVGSAAEKGLKEKLWEHLPATLIAGNQNGIQAHEVAKKLTTDVNSKPLAQFFQETYGGDQSYLEAATKQYQSLKGKNPNDVAMDAFGYGVLSGSPFLVAELPFINKLNKLTGGSIGEYLSNTAKGGVTTAVQMGTMKAMQNWGAQKTYNVAQEISQDVDKAMESGFVIGAAIPALVGLRDALKGGIAEYKQNKDDASGATLAKYIAAHQQVQLAIDRIKAEGDFLKKPGTAKKITTDNIVTAAHDKMQELQGAEPEGFEGYKSKRELRFLQKNIDNPEALAEAYGLKIEDPLSAEEQSRADELELNTGRTPEEHVELEGYRQRQANVTNEVTAPEGSHFNPGKEALAFKYGDEETAPKKFTADTKLKDAAMGRDVMYKGEVGSLDRNDNGEYVFVDANDKEHIIPIEDKTEASVTLGELGITEAKPITQEDINRALRDKEQVGEVKYNGKSYFVSIANPKLDNTVGDLVGERKANGTIIEKFGSNHPDQKFAKEKKLAIINKYLEEQGLPKRTELVSSKEKSKSEEKKKEVAPALTEKKETVKVQQPADKKQPYGFELNPAGKRVYTADQKKQFEEMAKEYDRVGLHDDAKQLRAWKEKSFPNSDYAPPATAETHRENIFKEKIHDAENPLATREYNDKVFGDLLNTGRTKPINDGIDAPTRKKVVDLIAKARKLAKDGKITPEELQKVNDLFFDAARYATVNAPVIRGWKNGDIKKAVERKAVLDKSITEAEKIVGGAENEEPAAIMPEAEQIKFVTDNKERLINKYLSENGNHIDPDAVRDLLFEIGYDRSNVVAYKKAGQILTDEIYQEALKRNKGKVDKVIFAAGLPATGKTRVLLAKEPHAIVFDGTTNDSKRFKALIDAAHENGYKTEFSIFYSHPERAFKSNIDRGLRTGRLVPITQYEKVAGSINNRASWLKEHFGDDVLIRNFEHTNFEGKPLTEPKPIEIDENKLRQVADKFQLTPEQRDFLFRRPGKNGGMDKEALSDDGGGAGHTGNDGGAEGVLPPIQKGESRKRGSVVQGVRQDKAGRVSKEKGIGGTNDVGADNKQPKQKAVDTDKSGELNSPMTREKVKDSLVSLRDAGILVSPGGKKPMSDAQIDAQMQLNDALAATWDKNKPAGAKTFYETFLKKIQQGDLSVLGIDNVLRQQEGSLLPVVHQAALPGNIKLNRYTLSIFNDKTFEQLQNREVSPQQIMDLLKSRGKEIEKELIRETLNEPEFVSAKRINFNRFRAAVEEKIMPLERIYSSKYNDYGLSNFTGQRNVYGTQQTVIFNTPITHGVEGHFGDEFNPNKRADKEYEVRQYGDQFIAIEKGVTPHSGWTQAEVNEHIGSANTTRQGAEDWVKEFEARKAAGALPIGLYGHNRYWYRAEAGQLYVPEQQSDVFQKILKEHQKEKFDEWLEMNPDEKEKFDKSGRDEDEFKLSLEYNKYRTELSAKGIAAPTFEDALMGLIHKGDKVTNVNEKFIDELNELKQEHEEKVGDLEEPLTKYDEETNEHIQKKYVASLAKYNADFINNKVLPLLPESARKIIYRQESNSRGGDISTIVSVVINGKEYSRTVIGDARIGAEHLLRMDVLNDINFDEWNNLKKDYRDGDDARRAEADKQVRAAREKGRQKIENEIEQERTALSEKYHKAVEEATQKHEEKLREMANRKDRELTPFEKQFVASYTKDTYRMRQAREAIAEAVQRGANEVLFPAPYTLGVVEQYYKPEKLKLKSKPQGEMPYTIESGDESGLETGDKIEIDGTTHLVVDHSDTGISVLPEDDVESYSRSSYIDDMIDNDWSEMQYSLGRAFGRSDSQRRRSAWNANYTREDIESIDGDGYGMERLKELMLEKIEEQERDYDEPTTSLDYHLAAKDENYAAIKKDFEEQVGNWNSEMTRSEIENWDTDDVEGAEDVKQEMLDKIEELEEDRDIPMASPSDFDDEMRDYMSRSYDNMSDSDISGRSNTWDYPGDSDRFYASDEDPIEYLQPSEYGEAEPEEPVDPNQLELPFGEEFAKPELPSHPTEVSDEEFEKLPDERKEVINNHRGTVLPILKKLRPDLELVRDDNGFMWYRTKLTDADRNSPTIAYQKQDGEVRGAVQFQNDVQATAHFFNGANIATLAHELSGHVGRRMLSELAKHNENFARDLGTIEKWAGAKNGLWDTAAEEKFARGFEKYLREGKAPTSALKNAFSNLAKWLTTIYKTLAGSDIDVELTPEVREVFDRLLGAEKKVAASTSSATEITPTTAAEQGELPPTPNELPKSSDPAYTEKLGIPGISGFISRDVMPNVEAGIAGLKTFYEDVQRNIKQWYNTGAPKNEAKTLLRPYLADVAQMKDAAWATMRARHQWWDTVAEDDKIQFINQMESGKIGVDAFKAIGYRHDRALVMASLAKEYRERLEAAHQLELTYKDRAAYIENYFPHLWEAPEKAEKFFGTAVSKMGRQAFEKMRTIDFIKTGMDAGMKLKTSNPEEIVMMREFSGWQRKAMNDFMKKMSTQGLVKYVYPNAETGKYPIPDGFKRLTDDNYNRLKIYSPDGKGMPVFAAGADVVMSNYLSPSLYGAPGMMGKLFRGNMAAKNFIVSIKLLSGYHIVSTSISDVATQMTLALRKMGRGDVMGALANLAKTPVSPITDILSQRGKSDVMKAWDMAQAGEPIKDPEMAEAIDLIKRAGGRPHLSEVWQMGLNGQFSKALQELKNDNIPGAGIRAVHAAMGVAQKIILESYVGRLKINSYLKLANDYMASTKEPNTLEQDKHLQKLWDSMDNRFGQLVYDNLFWKRAIRDLGTASTLSLGWNLGTIREFGGAVKDIPADIKNAIKTGKPAISDRILFAATYPVVVGMIGGLMTYLQTGQKPNSLIDYYYPASQKDEDGNTTERIQIPSMMKEFFATNREIEGRGLVKGTGTYLTNKLAPEFGMTADLLKNEDYYGVEISNPNDPVVEQAKQIGKFLLEGGLEPIFMSSLGKDAEEGRQLSVMDKTKAIMGFSKAPRYISNTPLENKIFDLFEMRNQGMKPYTDREEAELKRKIRAAHENDDDETAQQLMDDAEKEGKLRPSQIKDLQSAFGKEKKNSAVYMFQRLPFADRQQLFSKMTDEEKEMFDPDGNFQKTLDEVEAAKEE